MRGKKQVDGVHADAVSRHEQTIITDTASTNFAKTTSAAREEFKEKCFKMHRELSPF